jgi:hypothetical protein
MAVHKGPASLRHRCTQSGSSVATVPIYQVKWQYSEIPLIWLLIVGGGPVLQAGRSQVRFPTVSLEFFIDIILPAALWHYGTL